MQLGHEGRKHYTNRMQVLEPNGYGDMLTVTLQWGRQGAPMGGGGVHELMADEWHDVQKIIILILITVRGWGPARR